MVNILTVKTEVKHKMSNLLERMSEEVKRLGGPVSVAKALGVSKGTIYNWLDKGTAPLEKLVGLATLGADIGYIFSGYRTGEDELLVFIPRYEVRASAGPGNHVYDEEVTRTFAFRCDWLHERGLKAHNLSVASVSGFSMEPDLHDGDIVLLDHSQTEIVSGKPYFTRIDNELLVKYLQRLPEGRLQLSSANPKWPPFTVGAESGEVEIIGRVICSSHEW